MRYPGIEGKVALVTGAAGGIGSEVARVLAGNGAVVAGVDLDDADYRADVRDSAQVATVVKRVEGELGPISILVNVAGVLWTGPVVEMADEDWDHVLAVNLGGVFNFSREVARHMTTRGSGSIVTVGSNAGGVPRMNMAAYASSKAAVSMFSKCLGLELAGRGIRCNVVAPGSTDTRMQRGISADVVRGSLETFRAGIPLGRIAQPADIARVVAFLASSDAAHITMQDIYVDGGAALR